MISCILFVWWQFLIGNIVCEEEQVVELMWAWDLVTSFIPLHTAPLYPWVGIHLRPIAYLFIQKRENSSHCKQKLIVRVLWCLPSFCSVINIVMFQLRTQVSSTYFCLLQTWSRQGEHHSGTWLMLIWPQRDFRSVFHCCGVNMLDKGDS